MARIRIVDEWLRSPASQPTYYRSIMVVAERWAEQRVLMRAYAECGDQTRPTIVLHGIELAVGPSSLDPNDAWGIHVQPPVDGRAQALKEALELAARRMSGSKGNAPRLEDEGSDFERKRTNNWAPGAPRDRAGDRLAGSGWEPAPAASLHTTAVASVVPGLTAVPVPQHQAAAYVPAAPPAEVVPMGPLPVNNGLGVAPPTNPGERKTPLPVRWRSTITAGSPPAGWPAPSSATRRAPGPRARSSASGCGPRWRPASAGWSIARCRRTSSSASSSAPCSTRSASATT